MKYRVIEGGFWRHGSLHIESDFNKFESDNTGIELYEDMTNWLINNEPKFSSTYNLGSFLEFFSISTGLKDKVINVTVGEESDMWFVPETSPFFEEPTPLEGSFESWLHGVYDDAEWSDGHNFEFHDIFPSGKESVPGSLPSEWGHTRYYREKAV
jgi:hypothetical protein